MGEIIKKGIVIIITLLALSISGCYNKSVKVMYGNDETEILQYLHETNLLDSIGKENVSIVDTTENNNSKIVGFASDRGQGFLLFEKDKKGNYTMSDNMAKGIDKEGIGITKYTALHNYNSELNHADKDFIVISNGNNNVSKIEITINNKYKYSKSIEVGKPSMVVFEENLPEEESKAIGYVVRCFDIDNKEIAY